MLVRSGKMRASAAMQDRVLNHDKVEVHFNTGVRDAFGDKKGLKGLILHDTRTGTLWIVMLLLYADFVFNMFKNCSCFTRIGTSSTC